MFGVEELLGFSLHHGLAFIEEEAAALVDGAAEVALTSRDDLSKPEQALYPGFSQGGLVGEYRTEHISN